MLLNGSILYKEHAKLDIKSYRKVKTDVLTGERLFSFEIKVYKVVDCGKAF